MKIALISLASLALLLLIGSAFLGWKSHHPPQLGIANGTLLPCPASPNCVCSEDGTDLTHRVSPLPTSDPRILRAAIEQLGGDIKQTTDHYLHATFTSHVFRFVDDLELRIDPDSGNTELRSASRVGHSDLGVNRKRIEALRNLLLTH